MAMLDHSYTYGGKKMHTGFDCSGLVSFVYKESAGISLKGSAAQMAGVTQSIDPSFANPGDLVFFNTLGSSFSHVGIYIGGRKMIDAAGYGEGVRVSPITGSWWSRTYSGVGRVLPS